MSTRFLDVSNDWVNASDEDDGVNLASGNYLFLPVSGRGILIFDSEADPPAAPSGDVGIPLTTGSDPLIYVVRDGFNLWVKAIEGRGGAKVAFTEAE